MNRDSFEAELLRQDFEVREARIPPNQHRPPHTHEFDARLFIISGALTLVRGGTSETFGPGQSCDVPAGTPHEEVTGASGVHYLAGRRMPALARAAE
jgi:mannose-6-phosphate isomerase-like protein (cupin superfamily)